MRLISAPMNDAANSSATRRSVRDAARPKGCPSLGGWPAVLALTKSHEPEASRPSEAPQAVSLWISVGNPVRLCRRERKSNGSCGPLHETKRAYIFGPLFH